MFHSPFFRTCHWPRPWGALAACAVGRAPQVLHLRAFQALGLLARSVEQTNRLCTGSSELVSCLFTFLVVGRSLVRVWHEIQASHWSFVYFRFCSSQECFYSLDYLSFDAFEELQDDLPPLLILLVMTFFFLSVWYMFYPRLFVTSFLLPLLAFTSLNPLLFYSDTCCWPLEDWLSSLGCSHCSFR